MIQLKPTKILTIALAIGISSACLMHPPAARAQTDNPAALIQWSDGLACDVVGSSADQAGCCGAPGWRECNYVINWGKGSGSNDPSPGCVNPGTNLLRLDPYEDVQVKRCDFENPSDAPLGVPIVPVRSASNPSFAFYFTSDLHYVESPVDVPTSLYFPFQMNTFANLQVPWPAATGIPAGDTIPPPAAVVMGGDLTTGGGIEELGDFRLVWEQGRNPSGIAYPILPGLGNHDVADAGSGGAGAATSAARMYEYIGNAVPAVSMDRSMKGIPGEDDSPVAATFLAASGSHNYSWDWQGVHFVQLNCWAGFSGNYVNTISDGLTWLKNDLEQNVGHSQRPVVLFQHFDLLSTGNKAQGEYVWDSVRPSNGIWAQVWWTVDDYTSFWNIIRDYNVIGLFDGHQHHMQVNRPEHYANKLIYLDFSPADPDVYRSTNDPGLPSPLDSAGNAKILDEFKNGTGGYCQSWSKSGIDLCLDGKATFYATRISADYMDVGAAIWHSGSQIVPQLGEPADRDDPVFSNRTPGFWGGTTACRKRINSAFVDVSQFADSATSDVPASGDCTSISASGLTFNPLSSAAVVQDQCVTIQNSSAFTMKGPIALRITNGNESSGAGLGSVNNVTTRSFVDSCDEWYGNGYVIVSESGLPPGGSASARVTFQNTPGTIKLSATELLPLGTSQLFLDRSIIVSHSTNPGSQVINVFAPGSDSFTTLVSGVAGSRSDWLSVSNASSLSSHSGNFTVDFDGSRLVPQQNNIAQVTVTGSDGSSAILTVQVLLYPPLVAAPASLSMNSVGALVRLSAADGSHQAFTAIPGHDFTVYPATGTTPATLKISIDPTVVNPGKYSESLIVKWGSGSLIQVPVSFQIESFKIATNPPVQFGVDGENYTGSAIFRWISGTQHELTAFDNLPAQQAGTLLKFKLWSDGLPLVHPLVAPDFGTTQQIVATYTPLYQLSLSSDPTGLPGTITASPDPQASGGYYAAATSVTLTATPATGDYFSNFAGDAGGATNPQTIVVNKPEKVVARFLSDNAGQTEIETVPANHLVWIDGTPYKTPQIFHWRATEAHTITVSPDPYLPDGRWIFGSWTDGLATPSRTVSGIHSGFQKFSANLMQQFEITATTIPSGSATVLGTGWYANGTSATLTANPAAGFAFTSFQGGVSSKSDPLTVSVAHPLVVEAEMTATANPHIVASRANAAVAVPSATDLRTVTIRIRNDGPGPAGDLAITAIDRFHTTAGSGFINLFGATPVPIPVGTLFPHQYKDVKVTMSWPSEVSNARFALHFSANTSTFAAVTAVSAVAQ